jgi:hypothetical protein
MTTGPVFRNKMKMEKGEGFRIFVTLPFSIFS